ncbi:MAG: homocysteine S-methyltransferase family protein [Verrucomicrobiales bacterium]|nr:homocysteine S-methyltransferase family protein [Verrucomicrobiales bacterium]
MSEDLAVFRGAGVLVADGSWATALERQGMGPRVLPVAWNVWHPDRVAAVVRSMVEAGSQVIVANTEHANRARAAGSVTTAELKEWNQLGVRIAREAAEGRARVFGGIGPTGKSLMARETTVPWLRETYRAQIEALVEAQVDAVIIERMSDLSEARLAVEEAKRFSVPVVATMLFEAGRSRDQTVYGTTVELAAVGLAESGADAVGLSGGWELSQIAPLVKRMREVADLPVWVRALPDPEPIPSDNPETAPRRSPQEQFGRAVEALVDAGVRFLAGGGGAGPEFLGGVVAALEKLPGARAVTAPAKVPLVEA